MVPIILESKTTLVSRIRGSQAEMWYQILLQKHPDFAGQIAIHHIWSAIRSLSSRTMASIASDTYKLTMTMSSRISMRRSIPSRTSWKEFVKGSTEVEPLVQAFILKNASFAAFDLPRAAGQHAAVPDSAATHRGTPRRFPEAWVILVICGCKITSWMLPDTSLAQFGALLPKLPDSY